LHSGSITNPARPIPAPYALRFTPGAVTGPIGSVNFAARPGLVVAPPSGIRADLLWGCSVTPPKGGVNLEGVFPTNRPKGRLLFVTGHSVRVSRRSPVKVRFAGLGPAQQVPEKCAQRHSYLAGRCPDQSAQRRIAFRHSNTPALHHSTAPEVQPIPSTRKDCLFVRRLLGTEMPPLLPQCSGDPRRGHGRTGPT